MSNSTRQAIVIPDLAMLGIPEPLSYIARLEFNHDSHEAEIVKGNCARYRISKGAPILTFHFDQYENFRETDKTFFSFLKRDNIATDSFTLYSPVNGAIRKARETRIRTNERGGSGFMYYSMIGSKFIPGEILLDQGQVITPEDNRKLNNFAHRIFAYIRGNYKLNRHNLGSRQEYKLVRLGNISDEEFSDGYERFDTTKKLSDAIGRLLNDTADPVDGWKIQNTQDTTLDFD